MATDVGTRVARPVTLGRRGARRFPVTVIEPRRHGLIPAAREVWDSRSFIPYFGRVFIRKRVARTFLGMLWLPLRPSISLLSKLLVFGGLVGISSGKTPYPLFFLTASAFWQLFHEAAYWATRSIDVNRFTLRAVHVPRITVIISAVIPTLMEFAVYGGFAVCAVIYYRVRAHTSYLSIHRMSLVDVPVGLLLILFLGIGVGLITATLGARARDVRFALSYLLGFAYFLTPVIYPLSKIPPKYRPIAELNPVTGAMQLVKEGIFGGHDLSTNALIVSFVAVLVLWIPGVWLFHRAEVRSGRAAEA
jgi:lipopolysaccharide transport system permease protein